MAEVERSDTDLLRTGVYVITNLINGKVYVGSAAQSFRRRWNRHLRELRQGQHHSQHLQRSYCRDGEAAFEFSVLEVCEPSICVQQERAWIAKLNAIDPQHGYNILPAADSLLGIKRSAETKAKIGASKIGKPRSLETREKLRLANLGKTPSEETRRKMSLARLGKKLRPRSAEQRADMSRLRKGKPSPHRGKKRSPESIEKMAAALRGRKLSPEHRAKVAAAGIGRVPTEQARRNMSAAQRARKWSPSPEQRAANSLRHKGKQLTVESIAKREATRRRNRMLSAVAKTQLALF